jgi:cyclopropane fatty-acyl-phospholipid synthase-like methyltransferase
VSVRDVNFDRIARPYRWIEYLSFGPCLARCRSAQLAHLTGARRALLLGDGDGRFLAHLLAVNPNVTADVVDSSRSMLTLLERRIRKSGNLHRICLHHADALTWNPTGTYDLIASHFFLDCFFPRQLDQLFDSVLPHATPGARWVISEFAIPPDPFAAYLARGIIGWLYRVFSWTTGLRVRALPDYAASLLHHGLCPIHDRQYLAGLLCSQLWTLSTPSQK